MLMMVASLLLAACGDNTATTAATTAAATTAAGTTASATTAAAATTAGAATTTAAAKTTASATTAAAATTASAATTAAASTASSGHPGIYREAWYGPDPTTLDPQAVQPSGYTTRFMYNNLYLGLTDYDEKVNVIPGIAKDWKATPDSMVWTFNLNPAAKFSSGRAVTAADVAYSYERAVDPKIKNPQALGVVGDIAGASDKFAGKADKISGIKVVNDTTIEFTLTPQTATAFFPNKLALANGYILDKDIVDANPTKWWETKSAGAGPFQLSEWQHSQKIVLTPNAGWTGNKVKLTRVEYLMVGAQENRLNLFESGQTDTHWQLLTPEIERLSKDTGDLGKSFHQLPMGFGFTLTFNMNSRAYEPFTNPKVRQAVMMALDSESINATPLNGAGIQASGIISNGLPGYKADQMKTKFDAAAAKKLLADAGYADGSKMPELTLTQVGTGGDIGRTTEFIQQSLITNLGMNVKISVTDQQGFIPALGAGKLSAWVYLLITPYPDSYSVLSNFFSKSPFNYYGYNNPEVDALLMKSVTIQDTAARYAVYQDIEAKILNDGAIMPLMWGKFYYLSRPYVSGYQVNVLGIMPYTNIEVK
jgi:ABC-type transport system substrate-binding protein